MSIGRSVKKKIKKLLGIKEGEPDYIRLVSKKTGWSYDESKKQMDIVKDQLGIPHNVYYRKQFYAMTRSRQERVASTWKRFRESSDEDFGSISEKTGMSRDEILEDIRALNKKAKSAYKVRVKNYRKYGMYEMSHQEAIDLIHYLGRIRTRTGVLREKLLMVDEGELDYSSIARDLRRLYKMRKKVITPALRQKLAEDIAVIDSSALSDPGKVDDLIADIEISRTLLGFSMSEYKMFHLSKASFEEKRKYLNDRDKNKWVEDINSDETLDLVNNKYSLYKKIGELFGRELFAVNSEQDFEGFCDYVSKHPTFVCKPLNDSLGRGVELITIEPGSDLEAEFRCLLDEKRTFLMEERVICDERLAAFNPDSLNTVRLIVYYDGSEAHPAAAFFRNGRRGSFVDNGGAGGIFISVDTATGELNSAGGDENGHLYEEHPDSHIGYRGFQMPEWQEALDLGAKACGMIGEECFIGWDLALNDKGKWVIIEGNGKPQYLNQGPLGHGLKEEFKRVIGI